MISRPIEIAAAVLAVGGSIGMVVGPLAYDRHRVGGIAGPGAQVVELTGVAATGTWTEAAVTGSNYWTESFRAARPILETGRPVLLRVTSSDVVHSFYCPDLGLGPVEVYPGHVVELVFTPDRAGTFGYYCTTVCGDPHFGMQGEILVLAPGAPIPPAPTAPRTRYWESPAPADGTRVARGEWLFRRSGCFLCHGDGGAGGVRNPNYIKDTVPELHTLAERLMLFERADAARIIDLIERGVPLASGVEDPPVPRFNVVLAQYEAVRQVIRKGNPAGKKDAEGPAPPLEMPAWEGVLSDADIDAVISYLLTCQPWEEEEEE